MAQSVDLTLDLPPLLSGFPVVPPVSPLDAARTALTGGEAGVGAGAGDVFWSAETERLSVCLVLEPEVSAARAQEMLFAVMVATGEAIGALCPPELGFSWQWPNRFFANGARVGQAMIEISDARNSEDVPDWMIVGVELRLLPHGEAEPGLSPDRTSLWDEGAVDLDGPTLISMLSRHFLSWINRWESEGFKPLHDAWLFRCDGRGSPVELLGPDDACQEKGRFIGLDETGNLLFQSRDETRSLMVMSHLDGAARPIAAGDGSDN